MISMTTDKEAADKAQREQEKKDAEMKAKEEQKKEDPKATA